MGTNAVTTLCRASLNYVPRDVGAGGGLTDTTILDGRTSSLPGWSTTGFELVDHESAVGDWSDDGDIADVHYAEVAALAERLSG
ncbi:MAG: hypothetical protein M3Q68_05800, partial [Actinomycetota bacterium]|nr:hypothetical protein [Actinomycetota bacterium]